MGTFRVKAVEKTYRLYEVQADDETWAKVLLAEALEKQRFPSSTFTLLTVSGGPEEVVW